MVAELAVAVTAVAGCAPIFAGEPVPGLAGVAEELTTTPVDAPGNAGCSHKGTCFEATGVVVLPEVLALAFVGTLAGCAGTGSCLEATAVVAVPEVAVPGNAGCSQTGTCLEATAFVPAPGVLTLAAVTPGLGAAAWGFGDWGPGAGFISAGGAGTAVFAVKEPLGAACKGCFARTPVLLRSVDMLPAITGVELFAADFTGCGGTAGTAGLASAEVAALTVLASVDAGAGVVAGCAPFDWGPGVDDCF